MELVDAYRCVLIYCSSSYLGGGAHFKGAGRPTYLARVFDSTIISVIAALGMVVLQSFIFMMEAS